VNHFSCHWKSFTFCHTNYLIIIWHPPLTHCRLYLILSSSNLAPSHTGPSQLMESRSSSIATSNLCNLCPVRVAKSGQENVILLWDGFWKNGLGWARQKKLKEACTEALGHHYQAGSQILVQDPGDRSGQVRVARRGWALWETVMAQCCTILLSTLLYSGLGLWFMQNFPL